MNEDREPRPGKLRWPRLALTAAFGLLLALGWWAVETSVWNAEAGMREDLLRRAVALAAAINPQLARTLTFTAADQGTPAFAHILEQMTAAAKGNPQWRIDSMALREGKIVFGPEINPENGPGQGPGTEYRQPAAGFFRVFKDRRPVTVGSVTNEGGNTFITALAPVLDLRSGEVLMVVGVDTLADDWEARLDAARRRPLLTTLALFLLLVVGVLAVRWLTPRSEALKIKVWIVAPTALVMLCGLALYGVSEYREFDRTTRREMLDLVEQTRNEWNQLLAAQAMILEPVADYLAGDPALRQAFAAGNRPALQALAQPILGQLRQEYGITHLYFIAPDRTCLLRAHQPDRYGDRIDRFTLRTAEQIGADVWGSEMGPLGTLSFRYVRTWQQDGQTIGYLELGVESEQLLGRMIRGRDLEVLTVIRKTYTTREQFEAGRAQFGYSGAWDAYPDFVVAHQTAPTFPAEVADWLARSHREQTGSEAFTAPQGERTFSCGVIHLPDAAGRDVADFVVLRDITAGTREKRNTLLLNLALAAALFGGVLTLLWSVTGAAERQLGTAFARVRESETRYKALFHGVPEGILVTDVQTKQHLYANPAMCGLLGYTEAEFAELGVRDIHPPESLAFVLTEFEAVARGEKTRVPDIPCRRKDGAVIFADGSATPMLVDGRQCTVAFFSDCTERKRAAEARRRTEEWTREMIENIITFVPEGLLVFSDQMKMVRQNRAFREIVRGYATKLGYSEAELERLILEHVASGLASGVEKEIRIPRKNETEPTTQ